MNSQQQQQLEQQRHIWDLYSAGWKKWESVISKGMVPINEKLLESLEFKGHEHLLDVASGPGEPGLSFSTLLPGGKVSAIDLSEKMVAIANNNASQRNIKNYHSQVSSASAIPFNDNSFDAIVCRFGIMFFPDLKESLTEMVRVLKPGGKLVVTVWSKPEANFFITLLGRTIAEKLQLPKPPADAPGIFRCADRGYTSQLFRDAGLDNIHETEISGEMKYDSPGQYWNVSSEIGGPVMEALKNAPPEVMEDVKQTVLAKAGNYVRNGEVHFGWAAIICTGVKK